MAYSPTAWLNNAEPAITAEKLNKMEFGIASSHGIAESKASTDYVQGQIENEVNARITYVENSFAVYEAATDTRITNILNNASSATVLKTKDLIDQQVSLEGTGANSSIKQTAITAADNEFSLTSLTTNLASSFGTNASEIPLALATLKEEAVTATDEEFSLTSLTTNLNASFGTNASAIPLTLATLKEEAITTTDERFALTTLTTNLASSFGTNASAIETKLGTYANNEDVGAIAQVALDVNGRITGWTAVDSTVSGSAFRINADTFALADATNEHTPFAIDTASGLTVFSGKVTINGLPSSVNNYLGDSSTEPTSPYTGNELVNYTITKGDSYKNTNDNIVYVWDGTSWLTTQGPTGNQGPMGTQGARGAAVLNYSINLGSISPSSVSNSSLATYWNNTAPAVYANEIEGDQLLLTNTSTTAGWTNIYTFNGSLWQDTTSFVVNGDAVVNGTLSAAAISTDNAFIGHKIQSTNYDGVNGFRLNANATGNSDDPTIYGAYIKGSTIDVLDMKVRAEGYANNYGRISYFAKDIAVVGRGYSSGFDPRRACSASQSSIKVEGWARAQGNTVVAQLQYSINSGGWVVLDSKTLTMMGYLEYAYLNFAEYFPTSVIPTAGYVNFRIVVTTYGSNPSTSGVLVSISNS